MNSGPGDYITINLILLLNKREQANELFNVHNFEVLFCFVTESKYNNIPSNVFFAHSHIQTIFSPVKVKMFDLYFVTSLKLLKGFGIKVFYIS